MSDDLVDVEDGRPIFSTAVSDFASILHPVLGLSKLVSKVVASRVQLRRIDAEKARSRFEHAEKLREIQLSAKREEIDSRRALRLEEERIASKERIKLGQQAVDRQDALNRRDALAAAVRSETAHRASVELAASEAARAALVRVENDFGSTLFALRSASDARLREIDNWARVELTAIDASREVALQSLSNQRYLTDQFFAHLAERSADDRRSRMEIEDALRRCMRLLTDRRHAGIAAETAQVMTRSLAEMTTSRYDGATSVLIALADPSLKSRPWLS